MIYYNEVDPFLCDWLSNLMDAGAIPVGTIECKDIADVKPQTLKKYKQCHFFAGIGGWALALKLAGWPEEREVWTGSCPCQPFSQTGTKDGFADCRHLWPSWYWLIKQQKPTTVFGEQVASKAAKEWFDVVSNDMERLDYSIGAGSLPACSIGSYQIRQRLFFVGYSIKQGLERQSGNGDQISRQRRNSKEEGGPTPKTSGYGGNFWEEIEWIKCEEGKLRPIQPGIDPLAHGIPRRVDQLIAYGNAVVPQIAAEFIIASEEVRKLT